MRKIYIALAIALATNATTVQAQSIFDTFRGLKGTVETLAGKKTEMAASEASGQRYDVGKFTIVGIKLGMNPAEVEEIMRNAGFEIQKINEVNSFFDRVQSEANRLRQPNPVTDGGNLVSSIFGGDAQGNHLSIEFISLQDGAKVKSISLSFNEDTIGASSLRSDVLNRYGQPSINDVLSFNTLRWCSHEETNCRTVGSVAPQLTFSQYAGRHSLKLSNALAMDSIRQEQIDSHFVTPTADRQRSLLGGS